jgi:hypothetical protein
MDGNKISHWNSISATFAWSGGGKFILTHVCSGNTLLAMQLAEVWLGYKHWKNTFCMIKGLRVRAAGATRRLCQRGLPTPGGNGVSGNLFSGGIPVGKADEKLWILIHPNSRTGESFVFSSSKYLVWYSYRAIERRKKFIWNWTSIHVSGTVQVGRCTHFLQRRGRCN